MNTCPTSPETALSRPHSASVRHACCACAVTTRVASLLTPDTAHAQSLLASRRCSHQTLRLRSHYSRRVAAHTRPCARAVTVYPVFMDPQLMADSPLTPALWLLTAHVCQDLTCTHSRSAPQTQEQTHTILGGFTTHACAVRGYDTRDGPGGTADSVLTHGSLCVCAGHSNHGGFSTHGVLSTHGRAGLELLEVIQPQDVLLFVIVIIVVLLRDTVQRYHADSVTMQTALPWRRRYQGPSVTRETVLPGRQRYQGASVTRETALPGRQRCSAYSVTMETALPGRRHHHGNNVAMDTSPY